MGNSSRLNESLKKIRTLSLFSGGGGLDIGFDQAGYEILFTTDIDLACCDTLRRNTGNTLSAPLEVVQVDIRNIDLASLPKDVDIVIGGPPCQSFSASGRRAGGAAGRLDQRGTLFEGYCNVLRRVKPAAFLFENVRGILATNKGSDFREIIAAFEELGYRVDYRVLDAEDFGAPQQRERLFVVGHKTDTPFLFPRPVFGPDSSAKRPYVTVKDEIDDIAFSDTDRSETEFLGGKYSNLLPLVPPGGNYLHFTEKRGYPNPIFAYRSRFSDFLYKANPDTPVKTLIASPGKYTGPLHWDNRYLTVNEYKRIQGFPDEHIFAGRREEQIRQIGNSVCPKIAYYLAVAIRNQVFDDNIPLELLEPSDRLSFDQRKGQKAKRTKAIHEAVRVSEESASVYRFNLESFTDKVAPTSCSRDNVRVKLTAEDEVDIVVRAEPSSKLQVRMVMTVEDNARKTHKVKLNVALYGKGESSVQTMWNAVDNWVRRTSGFHSLVELYGHFTEPHPVFSIDSFEIYGDLPILSFAKHSADFNSCSVYFENEQLTRLFGVQFGTRDFLELVKRLRGYRYDIRCHETNIAIPEGVYMVAYPFALPMSKQMNFSVRGE